MKIPLLLFIIKDWGVPPGGWGGGGGCWVEPFFKLNTSRWLINEY